MMHSVPDFEVRSLEAKDIEAVASLTALCSGLPVEGQVGMLSRALSGEKARGLVLVADAEGRVIGSGRVAHFEAPAGAPANVAPDGWYLLGLNVHPDFRRRGVGDALTRARLEWISRRASEVWFFTEASNEASIRLHRARGFRQVASDL